jgi:hypothetical protein
MSVAINNVITLKPPSNDTAEETNTHTHARSQPLNIHTYKATYTKHVDTTLTNKIRRKIGFFVPKILIQFYGTLRKLARLKSKMENIVNSALAQRQ